MAHGDGVLTEFGGLVRQVKQLDGVVVENVATQLLVVLGRHEHFGHDDRLVIKWPVGPEQDTRRIDALDYQTPKAFADRVRRNLPASPGAAAAIVEGDKQRRSRDRACQGVERRVEVN